MVNYAETAQEILAVQPRSDRHRELVRRSDELLEALEGLNLRAYGSIRFDGRSPRLADLEAVRLTHDLVAAVNELAGDMGYAPRRLTTTREALDAVFELQAVILGVPDDDQQEEMFP